MTERTVRVNIDKGSLEGMLGVPEHPHGVVLFAHGSGSSHLSPRNRHVAEVLRGHGLATLLIDLLTEEEEEIDVETGELRFDVELLAQRLIGAIEWLEAESATAELRLGCFGASTGAAAALVAAALRPESVAAVVSRGGRPDLAGPALAHVRAPTLLIVGGDDFSVIEMNRKALAQLRGEKRLEIVPGATHLFEEPGTLDAVARLAAEWFEQHLMPLEIPMQSPRWQV